MQHYLYYFFASPAIAEKPEWASKGKPAVGQKEAHRAAMKSKQRLGQNIGNNENKIKKNKNKVQKVQRKLDVL